MASTFAVDVSHFTDKAEGRMRAAVALFVQGLARGVIESTPVITGFLRGSWFVSFNPMEERAGSPDPSGSRVVGEISMTMQNWDGKTNVYLNNSANYGAAVEFGTSRFEGRGMVAKTFAKANSIFSEAVQRAKGLQ